ncbi:MAG: hypothetical protein DRN88_03175 [Candidatus Hydrothermarchaeota archaeon]|nr:MAG: hypothetical protein DRN88_03175 [Candidatus Hydrothermarchaeota archaeon]
MRKILLVIAILLIFFSFQMEGKKEKERPAELWVEIHDVSPSYGIEDLEEILRIIERHRVDKVVLFVIPNHGYSSPMHENKEFVKELRELEKKGYIIALHGYAHSKNEFRTSKENAEKLLELAEKEFLLANLSFPRYFLPPFWAVSPEVKSLLESKFDYVYYRGHIYAKNKILLCKSHDYTTYFSPLALPRAKFSYSHSKGIFRLTIHIKAANTEENLNFLEEFLSWRDNELGRYNKKS